MGCVHYNWVQLSCLAQFNPYNNTIYDATIVMGEPNMAGPPTSGPYTAPFGKEAHLVQWSVHLAHRDPPTSDSYFNYLGKALLRRL